MHIIPIHIIFLFIFITSFLYLLFKDCQPKYIKFIGRSTQNNKKRKENKKNKKKLKIKKIKRNKERKKRGF